MTNLKEVQISSALFRVMCACLMLVALTVCVLGNASVAPDGGYPIIGGQDSVTGTGFAADMHGDDPDEVADLKTWVDVQGDITNPPGPPAAPGLAGVGRERRVGTDGL